MNVREVTITRRLFHLGLRGAWEEALDLWDKCGMPMDAVMCSAMCRSCEASGRWEVALSLSGGCALDAGACTALMKLFGRCSQWQRAMEVFAAMQTEGPSPDTYALGAAVAACGNWQHVLELLQAARRYCLQPNAVVCNSAISACGAHWQVALAIMEEMGEARLGDHVTCGSAIAACKKAGQWELALALLESEPKLRNVVAASTAISACAEAQQAERAAELLQSLPGMHIEPSAASFNAASSCQSWDLALEVLWRPLDYVFQLRVTCGCRRFAAIHGVEARASLGAMKAFERGCRWQSALALLRPGCKDIQLGAALRACQQAGAWERSLCLFEERGALGAPPLELWNIVITSCAEGCWQKALAMLQGLRQAMQPDAFSYNSAIKACQIGSHWEGAVLLLEEMQQLHLADALTHHMVMTACMDSLQWEACLRILQALEQLAEPGLLVYGPAVGVCLRTLQWEHALLLVHGLWAKTLTPDTAMCNAVVTACERASRWAWAVQLLQTMRRAGPEPDAATRNAAIGGAWRSALFLLGSERDPLAVGATLGACARASRWEEAFLLRSRSPNLISCASAFSACVRAQRWLASAALRQELSSFLAAALRGLADLSHSNIIVAVLEQLQEDQAVGQSQAASFRRTLLAPAAARLLALSTSSDVVVAKLGGEVPIWPLDS
ncbi:unnamed protein product [Effrenium voratum]|uniref:Pentatricopeptide repeat-containing protein, chloroplastic n=1 Tax=Effrenium voratum TaxID=2562239 RepID=A0AA36MUB5_9DINO|nr:unnamed protein product [Effrenium voratum]